MKDDYKVKQGKIISIVKAVPKGSVASYGQIASIAGIARGHRLVAAALRTYNGDNNATSADLPWYRIIRADGKCGMDVGSEGYIKQFLLLKTEGVIANNGRVDMKRYQWTPDMDFLLFRPIDL